MLRFTAVRRCFDAEHPDRRRPRAVSGRCPELLERDGFRVVGEASDGAGALDAALSLAPDVVLLDVHLPGDDGFRVCERMLELPEAPAVVLTSSHWHHRLPAPARREPRSRLHLEGRPHAVALGALLDTISHEPGMARHPGGIILGLVAEAGWPANTDIRYVVADLATGWLLIGGGYLVWRSRPASRVGPLLGATGAAWFVGTLYRRGVHLLRAAGPRPRLAPTGRLLGWASRVVVAAAYAAGAAAALTALPAGGIAVGILIIAVGVVRLIASSRRADRSGSVTYVLGTVVGWSRRGDCSPPCRARGRWREPPGV